MARYRYQPKMNKYTKKSTYYGKKAVMLVGKKPDYISKFGQSQKKLGLSSELKIVDTNFATDNLAVLASCTPQCLNLIAQGDDINQRDSRRITLHSIQIRGTLA